MLKTIHKLGLDSTIPVQVGNAAVSPRDVVAACLPDPAGLGAAMSGLTCAGTWVSGTGKEWSGSGVLGPEALPAEPFLELLNSHGAPWECEERTPASH